MGSSVMLTHRRTKMKIHRLQFQIKAIEYYFKKNTPSPSSLSAMYARLICVWIGSKGLRSQYVPMCRYNFVAVETER